MGSGPGNKPSHGGNGYKIGSMVATVLSRLGLGLEARRDQESCAYARAEQKQSDFEKAKGSVDEGRPVYESKKRVAARPYDGTGREGVVGEGARGRTEPRWRETERKEEGDTTREAGAEGNRRNTRGEIIRLLEVSPGDSGGHSFPIDRVGVVDGPASREVTRGYVGFVTMAAPNLS
ncbi:hypothetical protein ALC56_11286 [Trachymyrmex septentrionalis]|uniref:Uncharacterized protein n=1 Tax=Trachymyrmex septentrionalis TaxID=34720 RepID=A0A195F0S7_9HYME|nr:hypothetical protein ALC56_11286 [Trachymyrmex septentrionalis]